ncbi:hypothetical protein ONZ45_g433 [Pleurotus djamor]|nr:hypothetical protein ONZ45_g433 [Pleurotus djamor]
MLSTFTNGWLANFSLVRANNPPQLCPILSLPYDIFLDNIFPHLSVEDIICLRRVNKLLYLLTCEPIIWKRFLLRMSFPLPPLRPTYRFSLQKFDFEAEQLVTRAISLDDNWRNHNTAVRNREDYATDRVILEMKLLPGGKYLVTSDTDERRFRYGMTIYSLEDPGGLRPVARIDTGTRVFHIQAKYMKYEGQQALVVACLQRHLTNEADTWLESCLFSVDTEIDTPVPFEYQLLCFHTSLESLEMVSDPGVRRGAQERRDRLVRMSPPFRSIACIPGLQSRMEFPTLFQCNQEPFVAFVQQPDKIHFRNLNSGVKSLLQCQPGNGYLDKIHRIRCIRVIPGQMHICVIRSVGIGPLFQVALFDMPLMGETLKAAPREEAFGNKHITHVFISDLDPSQEEPKLRQFHSPPPPIAIYVRTINPNSLIHYKIWPERVSHPGSSTVAYVYTARYITEQSTRLTRSKVVPFVLPGASRAIIYHVQKYDRTDAPPMLDLIKYVDQNGRPVGFPDEPDSDDGPDDILRTPRQAIPHTLFSTVALPKSWKEDLGQAGLGAITWDEGIGRVCLSVKDEPSLRVLDFATSRTLEDRFASWKSQQRPFLDHRGRPVV